MATKPGWYRDPKMPGTARYWDGMKWTNHTKAVAVDPAAATTAAPAAPAQPTTVIPTAFVAQSAAQSPSGGRVTGSSPSSASAFDLDEREKPAFRFTQSSRVRTQEQFVRVTLSVVIAIAVGLVAGVGIGALQYPVPSAPDNQQIAALP